MAEQSKIDLKTDAKKDEKASQEAQDTSTKPNVTTPTVDNLIENGIVGSVLQAEQVVEHHRIELGQEAARLLTDPYKDRKGVIPIRPLSRSYPMEIENISVFMFKTANEKRWLSHNCFIQADRHEIRTNIPALKNYLENCPNFGVEVFRDELPIDIMNEAANRRNILQHSAVENPAPIFYPTVE